MRALGGSLALVHAVMVLEPRHWLAAYTPMVSSMDFEMKYCDI